MMKPFKYLVVFFHLVILLFLSSCGGGTWKTCVFQCWCGNLLG